MRSREAVGSDGARTVLLHQPGYSHSRQHQRPRGNADHGGNLIEVTSSAQV